MAIAQIDRGIAATRGLDANRLAQLRRSDWLIVGGLYLWSLRLNQRMNQKRNKAKREDRD